jgi:RNA polymerase sigma-70 factor (ECF subfamily)
MVLLHFVQGLRYREVAEVFGVPVGTVKSRIHWAISRLAREWSEGALGMPSAAVRQRSGRRSS